jgi:hypothetical protein
MLVVASFGFVQCFWRLEGCPHLSAHSFLCNLLRPQITTSCLQDVYEWCVASFHAWVHQVQLAARRALLASACRFTPCAVMSGHFEVSSGFVIPSLQLTASCHLLVLVVLSAVARVSKACCPAHPNTGQVKK